MSNDDFEQDAVSSESSRQWDGGGSNDGSGSDDSDGFDPFASAFADKSLADHLMAGASDDSSNYSGSQSRSHYSGSYYSGSKYSGSRSYYSGSGGSRSGSYYSGSGSFSGSRSYYSDEDHSRASGSQGSHPEGDEEDDGDAEHVARLLRWVGGKDKVPSLEDTKKLIDGGDLSAASFNEASGLEDNNSNKHSEGSVSSPEREEALSAATSKESTSDAASNDGDDGGGLQEHISRLLNWVSSDAAPKKPNTERTSSPSSIGSEEEELHREGEATDTSDMHGSHMMTSSLSGSHTHSDEGSIGSAHDAFANFILGGEDETDEEDDGSRSRYSDEGSYRSGSGSRSFCSDEGSYRSGSYYSDERSRGSQSYYSGEGSLASEIEDGGHSGRRSERSASRRSGGASRGSGRSGRSGSSGRSGAASSGRRSGRSSYASDLEESNARIMAGFLDDDGSGSYSDQHDSIDSTTDAYSEEEDKKKKAKNARSLSQACNAFFGSFDDDEDETEDYTENNDATMAAFISAGAGKSEHATLQSAFLGGMDESGSESFSEDSSIERTNRSMHSAFFMGLEDALTGDGGGLLADALLGDDDDGDDGLGNALFDGIEKLEGEVESEDDTSRSSEEAEEEKKRKYGRYGDEVSTGTVTEIIFADEPNQALAGPAQGNMIMDEQEDEEKRLKAKLSNREKNPWRSDLIKIQENEGIGRSMMDQMQENEIDDGPDEHDFMMQALSQEDMLDLANMSQAGNEEDQFDQFFDDVSCDRSTLDLYELKERDKLKRLADKANVHSLRARREEMERANKSRLRLFGSNDSDNRYKRDGAPAIDDDHLSLDLQLALVKVFGDADSDDESDDAEATDPNRGIWRFDSFASMYFDESSSTGSSDSSGDVTFEFGGDDAYGRGRRGGGKEDMSVADIDDTEVPDETDSKPATAIDSLSGLSQAVNSRVGMASRVTHSIDEDDATARTSPKRKGRKRGEAGSRSSRGKRTNAKSGKSGKGSSGTTASMTRASSRWSELRGKSRAAFEAELQKQKRPKLITVARIREEMSTTVPTTNRKLLAQEFFVQLRLKQTAPLLDSMEHSSVGGSRTFAQSLLSEDDDTATVGTATVTTQATSRRRMKKAKIGDLKAKLLRDRWDEGRRISELEDLMTVKPESSERGLRKYVEKAAGVIGDVTHDAVGLVGDVAHDAVDVVGGVAYEAAGVAHGAVGVVRGVAHEAVGVVGGVAHGAVGAAHDAAGMVGGVAHEAAGYVAAAGAQYAAKGASYASGAAEMGASMVGEVAQSLHVAPTPKASSSSDPRPQFTSSYQSSGTLVSSNISTVHTKSVQGSMDNESVMGMSRDSTEYGKGVEEARSPRRKGKPRRPGARNQSLSDMIG